MATVAEVFLSTATALATAQKFTYGRPLAETVQNSNDLAGAKPIPNPLKHCH